MNRKGLGNFGFNLYNLKIIFSTFLLFVVLGCSSGGFDKPILPPETPAPAVTETPVEESKLRWEDNFEGSDLNLDNWTFDLGRGGWGNQELQNYTRANHSVKDGMLVIETISSGPRRYTSTRIKTQGLQEFQYGRIEARIKLPEGEGMWPAFWLLGANIEEVGWPACGEIDIMEYAGRAPGIFQNAIHTPSGNGGEASSKSTKDQNLEGRFHVYAVNWTSQSIDFYFDDKLTYKYSPTNKSNENYPFNKPMFIILNNAVGGTFGGPVGEDVEFPQEMIVDYVRVYDPD